MPDNKILPLKGLDNNNDDISNTLESDQSQFNTNINQGRVIPDVIGKSIQQSPNLDEKEKKTSFIEDATNTFSDKSSTPNAKRNSNVFGEDIPKDFYTQRYPDYEIGLDNEDIEGKKQSGLEKLAYTVPRVLGTFTKTVVQGVTAPLVGLGYLATGGNFIKNDYNEWLESYETNINKAFPLYETKEEKNSSFLGQIKYGNSWIHLAEFAAMGAGMVATGAITGGISEAALGALDIAQGTRMTANYINAVDKLSENASIISKLETPELMKQAGAELIEKANNIFTQNITEGEKLDQLTATLEDINKTYSTRLGNLSSNKQRIYGAASMLGMNAGMAAQANNNFTKQLVQSYIDKNGVSPSDEEVDKIKELADEVGKWTFGLGTVMSTFSFHGLFKGMIGKDAEKAVINETDKLVSKETDKGLEYSASKLPFEGAISKFGKIGQSIGNKGYKAGKFVSKLVDPWAGIGLTEFSLMGPSVEQYYKKKYETGKSDLIQDAIGPNVDKIFTKEGLSTLFTGMLGSAPIEAFGKFEEGRKKALNTSDAVKAFNSTTSKGFLNANMESIIRGKSLKEDEINHIAQGDEFGKYNAREQQLINYIYPRIKFGMKSVISKELQGFREQLNTKEGISKLQQEFSIEGEPDKIKEQLSKYLDHIENMATKMESNYKTISMRYGRDPKFNDNHIEKLLYLTQMTDNSTERIKKLAEELKTDPRLQDQIYSVNHNIFSTKLEDINYSPTNDIERLLTAESKSTVIRGEEGEKKYLAEDLYKDLHNKIDNLSIVDDEKKDLKDKVDDVVRLNFTRRNYLKQYHDIINNPLDKRNLDKREFSLINPHTEDYIGKEDVKDSITDNTHEIVTKEGKQSIAEGETYYAGSSITLDKPDGTSEGFRKFKLIREITDGEDQGKFLIKTDKGSIIPVDKDFLKKHDIGRVKDIKKSSQASFYDRNKLKRIVRDVKNTNKENKKNTLVAKQESLKDEHNWAINESYEHYNDQYRAKQEEINNLKKSLRKLDVLISQSPQKGMGSQREDIIRDLKIAEEERQSIILSKNNEKQKIDKFYDSEIQRLQDIEKELDRDPKEYLDNKAKASYAVALDKIESEFQDGLDKLKDKKQQYPNTDVDFEKDKLQEKKDKKIDDLKSQYRDLYDKRLKELQNAGKEFGTLEYSPSKDQLHFVNNKGEETPFGPKELKENSIKKLDGSEWDNEDKKFIDNYVDEKVKKAEEEFFNNQSDILTKEQDRISKLYDANEVPTPDVTETDITNFSTEVKNNVTKMSLNNWVSASLPMDKDSSYFKNASPKVKEWLTRHKNWADRVNSFLDNINLNSFKKNSELKDNVGNFKQPSIVYVHAGNQEFLGLPSLIQTTDTEGRTEVDTPLLMVMVHTDDNGQKWTVNNSGKKLKKIGEAHTPEDYSEMIWTIKKSATNKWSNGDIGYRLESGDDEKTILEKALQERKDILNSVTPVEKSFSIEGGSFVDRYQRNESIPLQDSGLGTKEDIVPGSIEVTTLGLDGKGRITVGEGDDAKTFVVKPGIPFLKKGKSLIMLNSKKFTNKNKELIYNCIINMVKDFHINKTVDKRITDFLGTVMHYSNQFQHTDKADPTKFTKDAEGFPVLKNRQISYWFNKKDKKGYLLLGKEKETIHLEFATQNLEDNEKVIKDWLEDTHHVVSKKGLQSTKPYFEIVGFKPNIKEKTVIDGKEVETEKLDPIMRKWDNYTQYSSSKVDPDGKNRDALDIPLTSNVKRPEENSSSIKGKYITTYSDVKEKPLVKAKEEPKKEEVKKENSIGIKLWGTDTSIDLSGNVNTITNDNIGVVEYKAIINPDNKIDFEIISIDGKSIEEAKKPSLSEDPTIKENEDIKNKKTVDLSETFKEALKNKSQVEIDKKPKVDPIVEKLKAELNTLETEEPFTEKNTVAELSEDEIMAKEAIARRTTKKTNLSRKVVDMVASPMEHNIPIENIAGFKEFMSKVLPQFNVDHLPYMIKNGKGGYSWGQYNHAYKTISLSNNAIIGTGFHEAFHAVFDSFLSPKEQLDLISEFKNRTGEYIDRFGQKHNYSDEHTDDEIIEQIADEFREHNLNNKVYENSPKKMSFFTKLKNFIKQVIFGKPESIQGIFDKINGSYYKDSSIYNKDIPVRDMTIFPDGRTAKQNVIRDLSDGFLVSLRGYLGIKNGGLIDFSEGNIKANDVFNKVKADLNEKLKYAEDEQVEGRDITEQELAGFYTSMRFLTDTVIDADGVKTRVINEKNWKHLIDTKIKDKLKLFKVSIEKEYENSDSTNSESISTPTEESNTNSKNTWGIDIFKSDAKDTAPREIQFLFNTILKTIEESVPRYNDSLEEVDKKVNSLLLNKVVEDNSLFYKTMHSLSGLSTLDEMDNKFKELAKVIPDLRDPYISLFGTNKEERNDNQWRFAMMFHKAFAKQSPDVLMGFRDPSGLSYTRDANSAKASDEIQRDWESEFKNNKDLSTIHLKKSEDGKKDISYYVLNPTAKFTEPKAGKSKRKSQFKFLEEIGFNGITEEDLDALTDSKEDKKQKADFTNALSNLYLNMKNLQAKGLPIVGRDVFGSGGSVRKLSEIAAKISNDKFASQYQRGDGEYVQNNILHNEYSRVLSSLNETKSINGLFERYPFFKNDPYVKNSQLLKKGGAFYDVEGNIKEGVKLTVNTGSKNEDGTFTLSEDMTGVQRAVHTLNINLKANKEGTGFFHVFMPADQSTDFGIQLEYYIDLESFKAGEGTKQFNTIFKGYLEDEINTIRDKEESLKYKDLATAVEDKINGIAKRPRAEQLRFFKNILTPELVREITEFSNKEAKYEDTELSFDDFLNLPFQVDSINGKTIKTIEQKLSEDLNKYVDNELGREIYYLRDNLIISEIKPNVFKFNGINTDILKAFGHISNELSYAEIKNILKFRMLNTKINSVEFSKLFYGDPAIHKDFLKRAKLLNSGTEVNYMDRDGKGFNKHANSLNSDKNKVSKLALKASDWVYHTFSNTMKGFTFDHGDSKKTMIVPSNIEELKEIFKNNPDSASIIDKYEKTNGIDAQSYGTIGLMRELGIKGGGTWTKEHEKAYQYSRALESLELQKRLDVKEPDLAYKLGRDSIYSNDKHGRDLKAEHEEIVKNKPKTRGLFNIIKYLGAGNALNDNKLVPNKLKTSTLPLYYELVKGTKLEDLYFFLMKNGLHYTGPESQHKEGIKKYNDEQSSPSLYKTDHDFFENIGDLQLHELSKEDVERLSYEQPLDNFNKIVETAGNHKTTSLGTQLRVLSTMDLLDNGMPKDFYDGDTHNYWEKQEEWNNLVDEKSKREASPLYGIYKDIDSTLSGMIKQSGNIVQETLGIGSKNGKPFLKDPKKFVEYVKEMCNTYNIPSNIKDALKIIKDKDGNDTVLIDQLPNRDSLEYIINSVIEREIIRSKMNGGSKILVSGEMFEANNRSAMYKNADGTWKKVENKEQFDQLVSKGTSIVLTSNDLKTYSRDKDGKKVNGMEVKINNHFKDKMEKWFEKNGKEIPSDEKLLEYLNNTEEGKNLLRGVGFRIPTQGLNSIDVFTIKGFVDDRLGDAIVVPSEITTKVGSDFDVDKLNTYLKNFLINQKTGMPELIKFYEDTNDESVLEKIWEQKKNIHEDKTRSDIAASLLDEIQGQTYQELENTIESAEKEIQKIERFIRENKGKDSHEVNSQEALHNRYFDLLEKAILHEDNIERLLTPNTTDDMLEIEKEISKIKHVSEEKDSNINYANNLDILWVNRKRQEMLEGKQGTSIFASGNTSHAMMQNLPVHLKEGVSIRLSHKQILTKGKDGKPVKVTSLSNIKNASGQYISDMISQGINGTVDVAANAWLMRMLPSKSLFSQTLFLLRAGVDPKEAFFFLNQPIIQEFIKAYDKNKNLPDDQKLQKKDIVGNIHKQFKGGEISKLDKFSLEDMKQSLNDWHKYNEFNNEQKKLSDAQKGVQRQVLNEFLLYEELSGELFTAQTGTYWGNLKKPTDGVVYLKNDAFKKGVENKNIVGIHNNLDNTWFGTMRSEITKQSDILNGLIFKTALPLAQEQMESGKQYIANLRIEGGIDKKISLMNKLKSNFLDFLTQNFAKENGEALNKQLGDLFIKEGSNISSKLIIIQKKLKSIERKYNKEAKEAKKNDQPVPARPDILDNLALKKLGASIRNPNDPHNIEIEGKPTSVNSKEDFTSSLEELKEHSDPVISGFYNDIVKFGILQSGIKGSRISYNDLIPHESYSSYIQQGIEALENYSSEISRYDENKVFWRTNWRDDNIVKKIKKSLVVPLESGDKVVHLPIYKANSPVVKTKTPITEDGVELTPQQIVDRRNISRNEDLYETELYKRVEFFNPETMEMEPVMSKSRDGKGTHYLYKQINSWGDSQYMQESYTTDRPSILEKNKTVNEVPDAEIIERAKLPAIVPEKPSIIEQAEGDEITPALQAEMDAFDLAEEMSKGLTPEMFEDYDSKRISILEKTINNIFSQRSAEENTLLNNLPLEIIKDLSEGNRTQKVIDYFNKKSSENKIEKLTEKDEPDDPCPF